MCLRRDIRATILWTGQLFTLPFLRPGVEAGIDSNNNSSSSMAAGRVRVAAKGRRRRRRPGHS